MELIIDANIFMSALISSQQKTAELLFDEKIKGFSPEFMLQEIEKHWAEIVLKSKLSDPELRTVLALFSSPLRFFPVSEYEAFVLEAERISPDPDDVAYFALALKLDCPIWSNDKALKEQKEVKVFSTLEVLEIAKR